MKRSRAGLLRSLDRALRVVELRSYTRDLAGLVRAEERVQSLLRSLALELGAA
jgi:hypothetical protein